MSYAMRRIAIVGCGGSGKSYVARELGRRLGIPVTHLDAHFYDETWNPLSHERFAAVQRELVAAESWVIDGNYNSTLEIRLRAADTVVFLDVPTRTALTGVLRRQARHGAGQDRANGVFTRITPGFIAYVWNYRRTMRPQVMEKLERHDARVVRLRSRREASRWLASIES